MKLTKPLIALLIIIYGTKNLYGQTSGNEEPGLRLAPSPVVSSLGTYGDVEVQMSTGGASKSINLFQLREGTINYNPSINYFATGLRVNDWGGRLGMNWSDSFTGVIYRTVNSIPDELATRRKIVTSTDLLGETQENLDYIKDAVFSNKVGSGQDSEYDVFSYNFFGNSGSFIIKANQAVLLNHTTGLRIELLTTSPLTFCITLADGTKYFFGSEGKTETCKHDVANYCSDSGVAANDVTTAWFLTKVVSPNNDILNFNYGDLSYYYISDYKETYTLKAQYEAGDGVDPCNPNPSYYTRSHSFCTLNKWTNTKYLTSVTGTAFNLAFNYRNRNDLVGDKLLENIVLKDYNNQSVSKVELSYNEISHNTVLEPKIEQTLGSSASSKRVPLNTRYFLSSVKIGEGAEPEKKKYSFSYKNPELLPHRFAFSQDLAGYYNGKGGSGFIPAEKVQQYFDQNPGSGLNTFLSGLDMSDRTFGEVGDYGLLTGITYPTGGTESISYEHNSYTSSVPTQQQYQATGGFINTNVTTTIGSFTSFTIPTSQTAQLHVEHDYDGTLPQGDDGSLNYLEFQLWDVTHNQAVTGFITLLYRQIYDVSFLFDANVTYQVKYKLYGNHSYIGYTVDYKGPVTYTETHKNYFGQRVKQVIQSTGTSPALTKTYSYQDFTLTGGVVAFQNHVSSSVSEDISVFASDVYNQFLSACGGNTFVPIWRYHQLTSYSQQDMNIFKGMPISYKNVTEFVNNEAFTASTFIVDQDSPGAIIKGDYAPFRSLSNNSWSNGLESNRLYGALKNGAHEVSKEESWQYSVESTLLQNVNNYVIYEKYSPLQTFSGTSFSYNFLPYTILGYDLTSRWYKLDKKTEKIYPLVASAGGIVNLETEFNYNTADKLVLTEISYNSKNEKIERLFNRPNRMVQLNADPTGVYQNMVNNYRVSPVIEEKAYKNSVSSGTFLQGKKTDYSFWNGSGQPTASVTNVIHPRLVSTSKANVGYEPRLEYLRYDDKGNIASVHKDTGPYTSYLWGYNKRYPIVEAKNAALNEIYHNNFEEESDFVAPYLVKDAARAHTGIYSGLIVSPGPSVVINTNTWLQVNLGGQSKRFKYSGWVYSTGPVADIFLFMRRAGETAGFAYVDWISTSQTNGWVYLEKEFDVPADVAQLSLRLDNIGTGSVWFDDLRIFPAEGAMTTYTYKPAVGMESSTDARGETTYYEYDSFQRLMNVKDKDGKIIKHMDYHYKQ